MIRFDIFDRPAPARRQEDNALLTQRQASATDPCRNLDNKRYPSAGTVLILSIWSAGAEHP